MDFSWSAVATLLVLSLSVWALASRAWLRNFDDKAPRAWPEWWLIAAVPLIGGAAYWPFAHNGVIGAGDSYHYTLQVADVVTQTRLGRWPVMAGQSAYAFNGNVHTVRTAPYFTHLAAVLDFLTGHKMAFWQLTNTIILGSGALAAWLAYVCARWLAPQARLLAAILAILYVLSPALGTPLMNHDMVATFVSTPWLPLVCAAAVQIFRENGWTAWLLLAFSLGVTWLAHPPIAIWITLVAGAAVFVSLAISPTGKTFARLGGASLLLAVLAGYVAYGVASLSVPGNLHEPADPGDAIVSNLSEGWPDSWKPIDLKGITSGNIQLGYALWAATLIAFVALCFKPRNAAGWFYLACFATLLCCVAPVPAVNPWLWAHFPLEVKSITNSWPMQRLYPVLAALGLMLTAISIGGLERTNRSAYRMIVAVLGVGLIWSGLEFSKLQLHAVKMSWKAQQTADAYDLGTVLLTRSSYALFGASPSYYSHAWMEPESESRLLDQAGRIALTNADYVEKTVGASPAHRLSLPLEKSFKLEITDDTDYLFVFTFPTPDVTDEVTLRGPHVSRVYTLPSSGESASFGSGETNQHAFRLSCPVVGTQTFSMHAPADSTVVGLRFSRASLPIRIHRLTPYVATVSAPAKGYLETPFVYIPGYRARVDGQPVSPIHSSEGLVSVPVPAGNSRVEVDYPGPPGLKIAGWFATFAFVFGLAVLVRGPREKSISPGFLGDAFEAKESADLSVTRPRPMLNRMRLSVAAVLTMVLFSGWVLLRKSRQPPLANGRIHFSLQFAPAPTEEKEPLVVTGKAGAIDALYIIYSEKSFQLALDHAGTGGPISPPLPLNLIHRYLVDYESPALGSDRSGSTVSHLRLRVDDRIIFDQEIPAFSAGKGEFHLGRNPFGKAVYGDHFSGWLERLP